MSVAAEVADHWPDHVDCGDYGPAQYIDGEGIVCGCGAVLGYPEADLTEGYRPGDQDPDMLADLQSQTDAGNENAAEFDGPIGDGPQGPAYYSPVAPQNGGSGFNDTPPWNTSDESNGEPATDDQRSMVPTRSLPEPNSASGAEDPINARIAAIDPTVIYTPVDVERVLVDIERRLEAGQLYQRVWERRLYEVSIAHELAWARAITASSAGAADMRKADATIKCIDTLAAKLEADIMTRAVRETMHNLRSMLSGFQSIARSVGASMTASGMDTNREVARYR